MYSSLTRQAEVYPFSASPSVVRRAGDKLYFGTTAEQHPKGKATSVPKGLPE